MKAWYIALLLLIFAEALSAQDLTVSSGDVWIGQGPEGGYHLYIRKKPDIRSVLLVETTRDLSFQEPNYAYRTNIKNAINGDELRIIDEKPLPQLSSWSLIDSTPEYFPALGCEAFHIYIPYVIYYGYPERRHGEVYVGNGTYFNIRTFTLPYADYRGGFLDNPFELTISQDTTSAAGQYMTETTASFEKLSRTTGGTLYRAQDPDDLIRITSAILSAEAAEALDVVFCLDTTASMRSYLAAMRMKLVASVKELMLPPQNLRIGLVIFRDYRDAYLTKIAPFTSDMKVFQKTLNDLQAAGGGDIPEAVHEGLYDAVAKFKWRDAKHIIILVGDAPPHPEPRGNVTEAMVLDGAREHDIRIHSIVLPSG